jgi:hypothetical protein
VDKEFLVSGRVEKLNIFSMWLLRNYDLPLDQVAAALDAAMTLTA